MSWQQQMGQQHVLLPQEHVRAWRLITPTLLSPPALLQAVTPPPFPGVSISATSALLPCSLLFQPPHTA